MSSCFDYDVICDKGGYDSSTKPWTHHEDMKSTEHVRDFCDAFHDVRMVWVLPSEWNDSFVPDRFIWPNVQCQLHVCVVDADCHELGRVTLYWQLCLFRTENERQVSSNFERRLCCIEWCSCIFWRSWRHTNMTCTWIQFDFMLVKARTVGDKTIQADVYHMSFIASLRILSMAWHNLSSIWDGVMMVKAG